ncbi:MAG: hypothetical protein OEY33_04865, partial [Bdellovibrionales bacterium]|nr:hypothetical protein [Bdellovibrionales bacterium]
MKKAYILIFFLFISCGGKKEKSTQTSFKFQAGSAVVGGFGGGVVVMGKSATNSFQMVVPNADTDVEVNIPDGEWEFSVIGWSGFDSISSTSGPMKGITKCDRSTLTINGEIESELIVNFSENKCNDPYFNDPLKYGIQEGSPLSIFPTLELHPCFSVEQGNIFDGEGNLLEPGKDRCNFDDKLDFGVGLSYRIRLPSVDNTGVTNALSSNLLSSCHSQALLDSTT